MSVLRIVAIVLHCLMHLFREVIPNLIVFMVIPIAVVLRTVGPPMQTRRGIAIRLLCQNRVPIGERKAQQRRKQRERKEEEDKEKRRKREAKKGVKAAAEEETSKKHAAEEDVPVFNSSRNVEADHHHDDSPPHGDNKANDSDSASSAGPPPRKQLSALGKKRKKGEGNDRDAVLKVVSTGQGKPIIESTQHNQEEEEEGQGRSQHDDDDDDKQDPICPLTCFGYRFSKDPSLHPFLRYSTEDYPHDLPIYDGHTHTVFASLLRKERSAVEMKYFREKVRSRHDQCTLCLDWCYATHVNGEEILYDYEYYRDMATAERKVKEADAAFVQLQEEFDAMQRRREGRERAAAAAAAAGGGNAGEGAKASFDGSPLGTDNVLLIRRDSKSNSTARNSNQMMLSTTDASEEGAAASASSPTTLMASVRMRPRQTQHGIFATAKRFLDSRRRSTPDGPNGAVSHSPFGGGDDDEEEGEAAVAPSISSSALSASLRRRAKKQEEVAARQRQRRYARAPVLDKKSCAVEIDRWNLETQTHERTVVPITTVTEGFGLDGVIKGDRHIEVGYGYNIVWGELEDTHMTGVIEASLANVKRGVTTAAATASTAGERGSLSFGSPSKSTILGSSSSSGSILKRTAPNAEKRSGSEGQPTSDEKSGSECSGESPLGARSNTSGGNCPASPARGGKRVAVVVDEDTTVNRAHTTWGSSSDDSDDAEDVAAEGKGDEVLVKVEGTTAPAATPQAHITVDETAIPIFSPTPKDALGVIAIIPGLGSSSSSNYIQSWVRNAIREGFHCVVAVARGLGDTPLDRPQPMCALFTGDLHTVFGDHLTPEAIRKRFGKPLPLIIVGFSIGGAMTIKYLSEIRSKTPAHAVVCINSPWDFHDTGNSFTRKVQFGFYGPDLAGGLGEYVYRHREVLLTHPAPKVKASIASLVEDLEKGKRLSGIHSYDTRVLLPIFGFTELDKFYESANCFQYLPKVEVPLLCFTCEDDPVTGPPPHAKRWEAVFDINPNILLVSCPAGGHMGYLMDPWSEWVERPNYMEYRLLRAIKQALHYTYERTERVIPKGFKTPQYLRYNGEKIYMKVPVE